MPMKPSEMVKILKKNGFLQVKNNNGSHQKFYNPATNLTVIVPFHKGRELNKLTQEAILKLAGLK